MLSVSTEVKWAMDNAIDRILFESDKYVANPGRDFTRARTLTLEDTLQFILGMGGQSLGKELYDFFKPKGKHISTPAFVQRRAKIKPEAFEEIFHTFNIITQHLDKQKYWGYRLYAVDSTAAYCSKNKGSRSYMETVGYNMWQVNALYDLLNHTYRDVLIEPRSAYNEPRACITMAERSLAGEKCIVIGDRGYMSLNLFEHLRRAEGVEYIIRVKNASYKALSGLPEGEYDGIVHMQVRTTQTKEDKEAYKAGTAIRIPGPSKYGKQTATAVQWDFESPCDLDFRVVRFWISDDTYETIITSLPAAMFPAEKIKELYNLRWGIETSFRELKYDVGLVNFHAKKDNSVLQEILAHILMFNFCERIAMSVVIVKDAGNKWTYAINRTIAVHICIDFFRFSGVSPPGPTPEEAIEKNLLPVRSGRKDLRKSNVRRPVYFIYRVA